MRTQFIPLAIVGALLTGASFLSAQSLDTNSIPLSPTPTNRVEWDHDRSASERALLPPGLKEKLNLTDDQRAELKPIEHDFATTSQQYQLANQPRIDAAQEANQQARASKSDERIQAARKQLQQVWAGLQPYRNTAVGHIKPLLTPEQITILEDVKNQWQENQADQTIGSSAN